MTGNGGNHVLCTTVYSGFQAKLCITLLYSGFHAKLCRTFSALAWLIKAKKVVHNFAWNPLYKIWSLLLCCLLYEVLVLVLLWLVGNNLPVLSWCWCCWCCLLRLVFWLRHCLRVELRGGKAGPHNTHRHNKGRRGKTMTDLKFFPFLFPPSLILNWCLS